MFIFKMPLISTQSCAPGISCTYQIDQLKTSKPPPPQPKEKEMFWVSMFQLAVVPLSTYPLPPSQAGRGSGFEACAKEQGFQGKTLKSWGRKEKRVL